MLGHGGQALIDGYVDNLIVDHLRDVSLTVFFHLLERYSLIGQHRSSLHHRLRTGFKHSLYMSLTLFLEGFQLGALLGELLQLHERVEHHGPVAQ